MTYLDFFPFLSFKKLPIFFCFFLIFCTLLYKLRLAGTAATTALAVTTTAATAALAATATAATATTALKRAAMR